MLLGRFEDLGLLGAGGMGEVRRVRDPSLDRVVALKLVPTHASPETVARFEAEAKICAGLEHPAIVPVHELGISDDGRLWFTMREVRGREFGEQLAARPPLRRVLDQLARVADAVAFAHSRGVVHRDLKPSNIMVGEYGEVFVLDWGIAKLVGSDETRGAGAGAVEVGAGLTLHGAVLGTPVYMSPEQAEGNPEAIGPPTDVWALGAVLYEVLAGHPPLQGNAFELLARLSDPELRVRRVTTPTPVDHVLWELCERCLMPAPTARPTAIAFAEGLRTWLDGEQSRERALRSVEEAARSFALADAANERARELALASTTALAALPSGAADHLRLAAWRLDDESRAQQVAAALAEVAAEQGAAGALAQVPLLPEAHVLLADRHRRAAISADEARDSLALARSSVLLERHARALPADHPARIEHLAWLDDAGDLVVRSEPAAIAVLERYVSVDRLLVPTVVEQAPTPLQRRLPAGSWRVRLHVPGRPEVFAPVVIARGGITTLDVAVPATIPAGTVYVPPGPFQAGGTERRPRRRLWCDGFVIGRFPVTMGEYVRFLDHLVREGHEELALRHAPQAPLGRHGAGAPMLSRTATGGFACTVDSDGDPILPELPAVGVDWSGAVAYAAWLRSTSGLPWRLPGELEWEKAARGVDGRAFPWGEQESPERANCRDSQPRAMPVPVDSFPLDVSPYGLRGGAGNVRDWTADAFTEGWAGLDGDRVVAPPLDPTPTARVVGRGGGWPLAASGCRLTQRVEDRAEYRHPAVGFRVACSWP